MFNQPIFDNGAKNIKKRKTISSTDSVEKVDICMEKNEIEPEPKNPLWDQPVFLIMESTLQFPSLNLELTNVGRKTGR